MQRAIKGMKKKKQVKRKTGKQNRLKEEKKWQSLAVLLNRTEEEKENSNIMEGNKNKVNIIMTKH